MYAASSGSIAITPLRAADGAAMSTDPTRLDVTPFDVTLFDVTVAVMTAIDRAETFLRSSLAVMRAGRGGEGRVRTVGPMESNAHRAAAHCSACGPTPTTRPTCRPG